MKRSTGVSIMGKAEVNEFATIEEGIEDIRAYRLRFRLPTPTANTYGPREISSVTSYPSFPRGIRHPKPLRLVGTSLDVIDRIKLGTMFLLASPMYRGTYTGAFKNLMDHVPLEAFEGKVVGLLATGATFHHYLAIDYQFRGLLAWSNAYILPGSVYLDNTAYSDGELVDVSGIAHLKQLGESLVIVSSRLQDVPPEPPCLTRQAMGMRRD